MEKTVGENLQSHRWTTQESSYNVDEGVNTGRQGVDLRKGKREVKTTRNSIE